MSWPDLQSPPSLHSPQQRPRGEREVWSAGGPAARLVRAAGARGARHRPRRAGEHVGGARSGSGRRRLDLVLGVLPGNTSQTVSNHCSYCKCYRKRFKHLDVPKYPTQLCTVSRISSVGIGVPLLADEDGRLRDRSLRLRHGALLQQRVRAGSEALGVQVARGVTRPGRELCFQTRKRRELYLRFRRQERIHLRGKATFARCW